MSILLSMLSNEEVEIQQQERELVKRLKEQQGLDDVDIHDPLIHEAVVIARSGGLSKSI